MINLMHGDCLERMKEIPNGSVDMILTDPPYGTTACKWDSIIPLEPMWEQLKRVIKPNGAIVMTASQPFTTTLIASNMKMFRQTIVWHKERPTNPLFAKKGIMKWHEDVCIFYKKLPTYNPLKTLKKQENKRKNSPRSYKDETKIKTDKYKDMVLKGAADYINPNSVLRFNMQRGIHPTQKPVALMEYLIKTYTNEGETVLDFTMGSGTTGVACINTGRNFIGIELDDRYFEIAENRIKELLIQRSRGL